MTSEHVIIVGAGHGGGQVAVNLAAAGHAGPITLIGAEPHAPYQRPPLSKGLLLGTTPPERTRLKPAGYYAERGINLMTGRRVTAVDRTDRTVHLADGETLVYDRLVLATGSRMRRLGLPGEALPGVYTLRTLDDALAFRKRLHRGRRLALIGGGYIGLELAAAAVQRGVQATVLERRDRVMARTAGPETADHFARLHRARGVTIRTGARVRGLLGDKRVCGIALEEDEVLPADLVVVGVGAVPETALAEAMGLACDDGIQVDEYGATLTDPRIHAVGDCSRFPSRLSPPSVRLESVQSATGQARRTAAAIAGTPEPFEDVPWFWTDQHGQRLQTAGLPQAGGERWIAGDPASGEFAVYHLREGAVIACEAVNTPRRFQAAKRLIRDQAPPPADAVPSAEALPAGLAEPAP